MLLAGARAAFEAAGATCRRGSASPARWKSRPRSRSRSTPPPRRAALRRRGRARLRHSRRDLPFRDRRRRIRARADGHERRAQARARQRHPDRRDAGAGRGARRPARGDKGGDAARAAIVARRAETVRSREPGGADDRRRGSPPRRRSTRWRSPAPGSPTSWRNSRRTGSARRSRASNTIPPKSRSSATSSPACWTTRSRSTAALDDALAEGWPLKRVEALMRAILRAGYYELALAPDVPARVGDQGICRRRRRLLRRGRKRHDQRRARRARQKDPARKNSREPRTVNGSLTISVDIARSTTRPRAASGTQRT